MDDSRPKKHPPWHKPVVTIIGGVVTITGVALLVTPGPGLLLIAGGLAILASEYKWARDLLEKVRARLKREQERIKEKLKK